MAKNMYGSYLTRNVDFNVFHDEDCLFRETYSRRGGRSNFLLIRKQACAKQTDKYSKLEKKGVTDHVCGEKNKNL